MYRRRFHRTISGWVFILMVLVTAFVCVIATPVTAKMTMVESAKPLLAENVQTPDLLQQGKILYDAGRFAESVEILQKAAIAFRNQGNKIRQAVALSNLALVYQKLGNLTPAQQTITESIQLLEKAPGDVKKVLPPILDIQGGIQLDLGQNQQALETWQRAQAIYQQLGDRNGVIQAGINQAQAWQVLGFYRRGLTLLTQLQDELESQPDSITKVVELRSLGDALQLAGNLQQSRQVLQQSLEIAQKLKSSENVSAALFSLGNGARVQQDLASAIAFYQQAAAVAPSAMIKIQAQINQLSLLVNKGQLTTAQQLFPQIQTQLANLPPSIASIYARIYLVQSLLKLRQPPIVIAEISATAVQQARDIGDPQALSFALGTLGSVYEQNRQWSTAQELTEQALNIAQNINAPDIAYRWHWQLGRLLKQQGNIPNAIGAYDIAVDELQTLRSDLVAVNRDVQFSFKESVEPVYRESVELLLQSYQSDRREENLDKARQRMEALQLAELDDFFREACVQAKTVLLDTVVDRENPTTAIVYPIILPQELQVIVKIPKQPLHHYVIEKSQAEVENILKQMQEYILEPDRTEEVESLSQQVYNWLIQPIESDLKNSKVDTLVFVLDGALRNVPIAALYDGKQYLVEKYAVALSLGLQSFESKPLAETKLNVLAGGLVEPPPEFQKKFPPLPEIKSEFSLISQAGVTTTELLDRQFNSKNLETQVNATPFNILHLATHGQFSSRAEDTFILAADGPINVIQFDSLLRRRDETQTQSLDMLVLSACQTALGDNRATLGLAGASVKAGARSTLASLWHINDKSTAIFIGEFYRELAKTKVTKAEALRRAQVTLLQNYPNYSRPAFWAPYVLVGQWR
ncbi:MAG: CHAT domain-containing protein [Nostoc sp. ChiSLP02]|nr:CHAT domain-containing protein [Nostoc sp. DedSLP05]MDZ8102249.1 CHAT domain-containing protein [Nostoc sp. DedSLP01]MDZ8187254.1 CHAT domain-containing protein [Nostoc sp. ChiSLP02]